ncbi:apolipophorin-iii precursor (apolp-iii) [Holotrichia oblita]|uniref:Apolipophorin-iii (Apolp-iii) n=1 Tax=Holotrichia oblita TaxID=644536 RepID=A0ACB9SJI9_HOLOL|nr:apolipophorin-iii precursor (apolp-iii) [Holotrichia oblita]
MAKIFIVAVLVALAFQASYGKPAESALDTLAQSAKTLTDELSQTLGLQNLDTEKLGKTLQDQSKAIAEGLQSIVDKLKAEVTAHQPEVDNVLKSVEASLAKTASDLKKSFDPKTQKQIDETRQKFDDGIKTSVTELQKLAKSVQENKQLQEAQSNIQSLTKSALDTFVNSVKTAEAQIKKAIDDHTKTHTH